MNLISYIEKYGNKTFNDKPLNEVDKLILSNLSYVDFKHIISKNSFTKISLEKAGERFFTDNYDKGKKILAVKGGIRLLKLMYKTNRYKDLLLFNYERIINTMSLIIAIMGIYKDLSKEVKILIPLAINICKEKTELLRKNAAILMARYAKAAPENEEYLRQLHGMEVLVSVSGHLKI